MNKKLAYLLLVVCFFGASAFVVLKYKNTHKQTSLYPFQERKGTAAQLAEWPEIKSRGDQLVKVVSQNPSDIKSRLILSNLYIQEARVSGNYNYYNAAAFKYINEILALEPNNFQALVLKSVIQSSQHHFADALVTAEKARSLNPYNAFVHGILIDGNVEMGNYKKAVEYSDKMMSIRPDIRSYSRVSYLREIYGDYPGAIEAMKMAIDAGGYGDEATAWARVQLGKLYEITGDLKAAEMQYAIALDERKGYAYALAGVGHVAMVNKDYNKAISFYQQADAGINDYALKEQLAELFLMKGEKEKADDALDKIVDDLTTASKEGEESFNHHADKELAYVYLLKNENEKAVQHALAEYKARPDNIDVNEAVAWAYYKNGEAAKAIPYMDKALITGSKNPQLLCRAALIYAKTGDAAKAKTVFEEALKLPACIDLKLKAEVEGVMKTL